MCIYIYIYIYIYMGSGSIPPDAPRIATLPQLFKRAKQPAGIPNHLIYLSQFSLLMTIYNSSSSSSSSNNNSSNSSTNSNNDDNDNSSGTNNSNNSSNIRVRDASPVVRPSLGSPPRRSSSDNSSGGRLCTLIGVPCRFSMLSTFSTFANVLFQYKSPRAEGAKTDPPHTY